MIKESTHFTLPGTLRRVRRGAVHLAPADANEICDITVKVRRARPLPAPKGGSIVIPENDVRLYGACTEDLETVAKVLRDLELSVLSSDPGSCAVRVAGSVVTLQRAFRVEIGRSQVEDREFRSRVGRISVPRALKGIVTGVFGLDSRPMTRARTTRTTALAPSLIPPPDQRSWFLSPELAAMYKFPQNDGGGRTVRIIALEGRVFASDIDQFCRDVGIQTAPDVLSYSPTAASEHPPADRSFATEATFDVEVIAGLCPGAAIALYFSDCSERGWIDALDMAVAACKPGDVISISNGLAEGTEYWTRQALRLLNDKLREAAARGIPVCVASGDDGSSDASDDGRAHVDFPASSPYVLAVGGTILKKPVESNAETIWFEGNGLRADGGGATGGGVSDVFARPEWQQEVNVASVNPDGFLGRCVPDVSAHAFGTGYYAVVNGAPVLLGGTSGAAPLWAALLARLGASGVELSYITPILYQAVGKTDLTPVGAFVCNDIVGGSNATVPAEGYAAVEGYDAATGWGSPNGEKFVEFLARE
jgi:kumamolisin